MAYAHRLGVQVSGDHDTQTLCQVDAGTQSVLTDICFPSLCGQGQADHFFSGDASIGSDAQYERPDPGTVLGSRAHTLTSFISVSHSSAHL